MAKNRDPSDKNDGALFRRAMADATPLPKRRRIASKTPAVSVAPPKATKKKAAKPASTAMPQVHETSRPAQQAQTPMTSAGNQHLAGIDRRTAERLRRGKLPIEARLDLHGRFQDEAHHALNAFITGSAAAGRRVVLVITGKGRVSEGGGVLRRSVPQWLRLPPCAVHVLAVMPAQPQHGGAGALYVMLRRKRF